MYTALREKTIVKTEGLLEIRAPELTKGVQVEVIVLVPPPVKTANALGWPDGFFDTFAGSLPTLCEPEFEGDYETREEL
ncbi:MAG: hypothetical protein JXA33_20415 [Anaerolineae bacterium]|nr:hypothetical protein [Anaerolineae bacterium]